MIVLGIESTAHTFGVAILRDREVLANERDAYTTESGGMIPVKVAQHHEEAYVPMLSRALEKAAAHGITLADVQLIAFSDSPGLGQSLRIGAAVAKSLALRLRVPLVGVNHCIAHLEVAGLVTDATDPVLLYCSGANTQVIAYDGGKYRVFGETLDTGVGNFLDTLARNMGLGFPGGPKIEKLSLSAMEKHKTNIQSMSSTTPSPPRIRASDETVDRNEGRGVAPFGVDRHETNNRSIASSAAVTTKNDEKKINDGRGTTDASMVEGQCRDDTRMLSEKHDVPVTHDLPPLIALPYTVKGMDISLAGLETNLLHKIQSGQHTQEELAYSAQEHVFAMLVETAERALAHVGKSELVLGGGVACNKRLQEMCRIMCDERGAKCFVPASEFLVDNAAMIAWTGLLMHQHGGISVSPELAQIKPYERTDDVDVTWR
jgi:tRNA A37 threonylcarbamoyltransferase TsaD